MGTVASEKGCGGPIVAVTCSRNQKDSVDSGVQFITPASPRQSLLLAKDPHQYL